MQTCMGSAERANTHHDLERALQQMAAQCAAGVANHELFSSTSLVYLERNRYNVPTEHANSFVSLRIYHDHIAAVADGVQVVAHRRCFDRSQNLYDWQHYISLLERKPGGLRNGAPFETMNSHRGN
jgi:hypothetical protein